MARRSASSDHYSSLALLQERFNELQKTREMRQEKELLRFISHAAAATTTATAVHYKQPSSCYYYDSDELMAFQRLQPPPPVGFSLIRTPPPSVISHRSDGGDRMEESSEEISWLFGTKNLLGLYNSVCSSHDSCTTAAATPDVDTSLHL